MSDLESLLQTAANQRRFHNLALAPLANGRWQVLLTRKGLPVSRTEAADPVEALTAALTPKPAGAFE